MRRHWSQRLSAVFFAIWFAIVGVEPGAFSACPMHRLGGVQPAASESASGHAGHHMAADSHSGEAQGQSHADHDVPGQQHAHHCTCPGSCCCAPVVGIPTALPQVVPVETHAPAYRAARHHFRAGWTDFVLPFPTAPPALTT